MSTSDTQPPAEGGDVTAAMFASLVMQNTNMALIFLGQAPHPQTGKTAQDLENARYFIDQLEMLEVKTKGNLSKPEATLLNQSLTNLRLAFVEAVEHPAAETQSEAPGGPPTDEQETPVTDPAGTGGPSQATLAQPASTPESQKKFSKKY